MEKRIITFIDYEYPLGLYRNIMEDYIKLEKAEEKQK